MIRVAALTILLTWGFGVFAYGRAQRISGFETWDLCNRIMLQIRADRPDWDVKDCDLDVRPKS